VKKVFGGENIFPKGVWEQKFGGTQGALFKKEKPFWGEIF